jgi:hypothetical protein
MNVSRVTTPGEKIINFFKKIKKKVDTNKITFYILQNVKYVSSTEQGFVVHELT